jgi:hypothetical protein
MGAARAGLFLDVPGLSLAKSLSHIAPYGPKIGTGSDRRFRSEVELAKIRRNK